MQLRMCSLRFAHVRVQLPNPIPGPPTLLALSHLSGIDPLPTLAYIWAASPDMTRLDSPELGNNVLEALSKRRPQAAFVTEVTASIHPTPSGPAMEAVLSELTDLGKVVITDHASPDPHLDNTDLRVVAVVPDKDESAALEYTETHWNHWLRAFLRTHRCQ